MDKGTLDYTNTSADDFVRATPAFAIPGALRKKGKHPRPAADYRAARRNEAKAARRLPEWRHFVPVVANIQAKLHERSVLANGAREVAAKAIVDTQTRLARGELQHVAVARAMLDYYRAEGRMWGRAVGRIVRGLERDVRAAEAVRAP